MDSRPLHRFGPLLTFSCAVLCLTFGARAAETTNVAPAVVIPKSAFVAEGDTGRDPFFPNSSRLMKKVADTTVPQVREDYSRFLKLTGVTGGAKPIATINNLTFAVGEDQEVKVEGRKIRIRVLDIREKSVIVSVEKQPAPIELKLRDVELKFTE